MALPTQTKTVVLAEYPVGLPDPEKNFKVEARPLPELKEGEVLIKTEYLSVDPYMRGRMRPGVSYIAPFRPGHPLQGGGVAKVVASRSEAWKVGDNVQGMLDWSEYSVVPTSSLQHLPPVPNVPLSYFLGILGMPGMTAYLGLLEVGKPKAGETVVVSGAAGAVGYLVGQIAKILGCFVIGIAGSDEKVELIKKAGFDAGINYKTTANISAAIKTLAPKGVDVYFDNVGGTIADAVFENLNRFARVACCGAISSYNDTTIPTGPRREFQLIGKSIKQEGFIVSQWIDKWPAGIKQMAQWLQEGKLQYSETTRHGLENTPKAFVEMLTGENIGKMIVSLN